LQVVIYRQDLIGGNFLILYVAGTLFVFNDDDDKNSSKFEKIYLQYGKLMYSKAYEILKEYSLAEDAVSEAFIRIFKNLHKLDNEVPSARTASFVVTVVKNVSLTMIQKQNSAEVLLFEESPDIPESINMEDDIVAKLSAEEIMEIVNGLPEDLKQVFLLYFAYDMSLKEIGKTLDITPNLAAVRLHRAKKKLSERIGKEKGAI
jgi:RNA polymerase sigma-70 factor (ECF subfamily)